MSGRLYHSPAEIVHTWLLSTSVVADPTSSDDWRAFVNNGTADFTNIVSVNDTTGIGFGRTNPDKIYREHHGIQIYVRGASQSVGFAKASEIFAKASQDLVRAEVTISGAVYLVHTLAPTSSIIPVGKYQPEDFQFIHTMNFVVPIKLLSYTP